LNPIVLPDPFSLGRGDASVKILWARLSSFFFFTRKMKDLPLPTSSTPPPPDVTAVEHQEHPLPSFPSPFSSTSSLNFQNVYAAFQKNDFIQTIYQSAPSRDEALGFADSTRKDLFSAADATVRDLSGAIEDLQLEQLSQATVDTLDSIYRPVFGKLY
jgi:hypothetical protein